MPRQAVTYPAQLAGPWRCAARRRLRWFVLLLRGTLGVLSCVTLPEQPSGAQPYARLVLPEAICLMALNTQTFDPRMRIRAIQVTPGSHSLSFVYAGSSPQHAGQQADPFHLEVQVGHQYVFDAKT
jgi:hypothetical protein